MKNLTKNWLILLSALTLTFTACEKDENTVEDILNLNENFLNTTNLEDRTVITDTDF